MQDLSDSMHVCEIVMFITRANQAEKVMCFTFIVMYCCGIPKRIVMSYATHALK